MPRTRFLTIAMLLAAGAASAGESKPIFERDILPVLRARCLKCHGDAQRKGGLSLRTPAAMIEGGDGGPALVKGKIDESLIVEQITSGAMPPGKAEKLSAAEIDLLKTWIAAGAPSDPTLAEATGTGVDEPVHWAFAPPKRVEPPRLQNASRSRGMIDAFLLAKLDAAGLGYSPEADRRILIRRATYDLLGLPPTLEEVEAFLADKSENAYERLIDRLLESPRYGERWGRHWLDIAGYADSEGILAADHVRSAAWRYRDWVIRAFNADMPYDRFLREQIAGDEFADYWTAYKSEGTLPGRVIESLEATGYLRCAGDTSRPDFKNIKDAPGYYYQTLEDTVTIVASSTLGLTLQCAKCHSHKYDPITQSEYYRVQAVFMSGYRPFDWVPQVERKRTEATEADEAKAKAINASIDAAVARRVKAIEEIRTAFGDRRFAERVETISPQIREDVRLAFARPAEKRTEIQRYLVQKFQAELRPSPSSIANILTRESPRDRDLIASLEATNAADQAKRVTFPEIRAFYDLPGEPKTPILQRGDYLKLGPEVSPGVPRAIGVPEPFKWTKPPKDAPTSGRRRAFAEWLTQPGHPLTARVFVNRIWMHHFGEGIVSTPENFGIKGSPPSHPELLDRLALEFVTGGWSVKSMHRMIMRSAAYRQSSRVDADRHASAQRVDPENRLLWRQRLRRVEAESLRDAVLAVSGSLNPAMGGVPVTMVMKPGGEIVAPETPAGARRSVYLQVRRSQPLTLLQVFDQPVMETNCVRRSVSTVSSQALNLLNSDFLIRQAEIFASRSIKVAPGDPAGYALREAFGREPSDRERALFASYLADQAETRKRGLTAAMADVCQMLLSSNEFAYID